MIALFSACWHHGLCPLPTCGPPQLGLGYSDIGAPGVIARENPPWAGELEPQCPLLRSERRNMKRSPPHNLGVPIVGGGTESAAE